MVQENILSVARKSRANFLIMHTDLVVLSRIMFDKFKEQENAPLCLCQVYVLERINSKVTLNPLPVEIPNCALFTSQISMNRRLFLLIHLFGIRVHISQFIRDFELFGNLYNTLYFQLMIFACCASFFFIASVLRASRLACFNVAASNAGERRERETPSHA
jgi:hypothetical protein